MGIRVLIVDDDEDIRGLLELGLGALAGVDIVGRAVDGADALDQVESLGPDIVVMDLMMPNMDGAQATEMVKRLFPNVMVLGFTALQGNGSDRLLRSGADAVFEKTSFGKLIELIVKRSRRDEGGPP